MDKGYSNQPRSYSQSTSVPVLMVTANVGSIFEDAENMLPLWVTEFLNVIRDKNASFIALHCQEIGGKNYQSSMKYVSNFIKMLMSSEELQDYSRCRVYVDEHYEDSAKFTALGNFYFIHKSLTDVALLDFKGNEFIQVTDKEIHNGNIEYVRTMQKEKFPKHYFPECKWSRKGFLRTRWKINGSLFDFINIHLFHDASNFVAMERSPSAYTQYRYNALLYTLDRFETDHLPNVPYFIFGDFNFRLDTHVLIRSLTENASIVEKRNKAGELLQMTFLDEDGHGAGDGERACEPDPDHIMALTTAASANDTNTTTTGTCTTPVSRLTIGPKLFSHHHHEHIFRDITASKVLKYDNEAFAFQDKIYEYEMKFPPTYPYVESTTEGGDVFMKSRCPAWCDRVLLSSTARSYVDHSVNHQPQYNVIGSNVCMGDHKPVYLLVRLLTTPSPHSMASNSELQMKSGRQQQQGTAAMHVYQHVPIHKHTHNHHNKYVKRAQSLPGSVPATAVHADVPAAPANQQPHKTYGFFPSRHHHHLI